MMTEQTRHLWMNLLQITNFRSPKKSYFLSKIEMTLPSETIWHEKLSTSCLLLNIFLFYCWCTKDNFQFQKSICCHKLEKVGKSCLFCLLFHNNWENVYWAKMFFLELNYSKKKTIRLFFGSEEVFSFFVHITIEVFSFRFKKVHLFPVSWVTPVVASAPVEPKILSLAWAYSSSRCFKLFMPLLRVPLLPLTSFSRLPSLPPPCEDRLFGVLEKKSTIIYFHVYFYLRAKLRGNFLSVN